MRIAIVQEHVDTGRGGAETSTVEMGRCLAALGLDVHVICRGEDSVPFVDQNVTFLPLAVRGRTRAGGTYRFVQAVHRFCRAESFDIVHAVTPCLNADVYQPRGGTYPETIKRSLAMTPVPLRWLKRIGRWFNVRQRFLSRLERILLQKRQRGVFVAAVSDYVRRQVETEYGLPLERNRVVFNGVDITPLEEDEALRQRAALRDRLGVDADAPLALFVAHNFRLKGLAQLLRATADVGDLAVVVAGRDDPHPFERLARRLGIMSRVHFVGTTTPVRAWYAAADVLAHPTWYDPCSRVVLEALCVGLPVVTTECNGAAEVMRPGRPGVVIAEPSDIDALAAALSEALVPGVREACRADAGRQREQLSMARHARELAGLYAEVVEQRRVVSGG